MATILVVDDHALNRQFLVTLLGQHGHHVLEASDGHEAVESARANHPDLVITDVLMPVLDGYGLVKKLRLDAATASMKVVFYTAHYAEHEARALAKSCDVASVLPKPAASTDVLSTVNRVLSTNRGEAAMEVTAVTAATFDGAHLSLLTDKLAETAGELGAANARLRALINVGLDFAAEPDLGQRLKQLSAAARELFGATYVTIGMVDRDDGKVQRLVTSGIDGPPWINNGDAVAGLLATTFSERRIVRGHNEGGDPTTLALPVLHPAVQAFLAAPIASPAHVYGWICLVGNEGMAFTADDEELVAALAGQLGRIFEIEHVITEREQAEVELRRERDRAQRYLDTAEVILLALDLDGRMTQVNRYACTMLGYTAEELIGRDWKTVLPPRVREQYQRAFDSLLAGEVGEVENPIQCASGEERLIQWRNTLLRDDTGHVIGTFSSGIDVTERDRSADALRGAEERTQFALETARLGI